MALLLWLLLTAPFQERTLMELSPGKNILFLLIAAASTGPGLLPARFDMMCCLPLLIQPLMRFLFRLPRSDSVSGSVPTFAVPLPSGLQSPTAPPAMLRGRLCGLLTGFGNLPVRDFHPLVYFPTFVRKGCPCRAHTLYTCLYLPFGRHIRYTHVVAN